MLVGSSSFLHLSSSYEPEKLKTPEFLTANIFFVPHETAVQLVWEEPAMVTTERNLHVREDDELHPLELLLPVWGPVRRGKKDVTVSGDQHTGAGGRGYILCLTFHTVSVLSDCTSRWQDCFAYLCVGSVLTSPHHKYWLQLLKKNDKALIIKQSLALPKL